jgi:asparagine synthase (glutamine-hydrolysing)
MTDLLIHRGPDDSGTWEGRIAGHWLGLGSRRLSIIDLSPAGHMPMGTPSRRIWISFNGEIYNHQALRSKLEARGVSFQSRTDSEVVLKLYEEHGEDCVKLLRGMFAFVIADLRAEPQLFLARDHFGVKPLYYIQKEGSFACASETKALLLLPNIDKTIDSNALSEYLSFLWVPEPRTIFRGIRKLSAGHWARFSTRGLEIRRFWAPTFPPRDYPFPTEVDQLPAELKKRFYRTVQEQMVSDRPVGVFLSSGLDSSAIAAAAAAVSGEPLRTFTIAFPERYRRGEPNLDKPEVAARTAQKLGARHTEIRVDPKVADLLPKLLWHMDDPVSDPAIILAYLVCQAAKPYATVLLSGVGGDEVFGGYRKYLAARCSNRYRAIPACIRETLLDPAFKSLPVMRGTRLSGLMRWARKWGRSASLPLTPQFIQNATYQDAEFKGRLCTEELLSSVADLEAKGTHEDCFARVPHAADLNQLLYNDQQLFLPSLNLNYNDKMSMANSVEVRVPFLDHELADWTAWNVPPEWKVGALSTKRLLRETFRGVLPDELLRQPKASFGAPISLWLAEDLKEMTGDILGSQRFRQRGWFRAEAVTRIREEHSAGTHDWAMQIWQLLSLELWAREFLDSPPQGK